METIGTVDRIKEICKKKGVSIKKLEEDCGFSNGYIGQLRKNSIPGDRLFKISEYLNVSYKYLITGEGYEIDVYNVQNAKLIIKINENPDLLETLPKYFDLSEEEKKYVLGLIDLLSSK